MPYIDSTSLGTASEIKTQAETSEELATLRQELENARNGYETLDLFLDTLRDQGANTGIRTKRLTATAGQSTIDVEDTGAIMSQAHILLFLVDGAPQYSSYTVTDETTITMNDGFTFSGGEDIFLHWLESKISILSSHKTVHEKGGYDELNVTKLAGYDEEIGESVSRYDTLQAAVTAIGTQNRTLVIADELIVTSNITVPKNINLSFSRGGKLTVNSGVTATINSTITAGLWQIFDGLGTINGKPKITEVYPEWFGAVVDDITVDNAIPLNKAQKFLPNVKLSAGVYNLLTTFTPDYTATFTGVGEVSDITLNVTVLKQLNDIPTITMDKSMVTFRHLAIKGVTTNPNNHGVFFPSKGSRAQFENVYIESCGGNGVSASGTATYGVDYVQMSNVKISSCEGYGIKLDLDPAGGNGFNTSTFVNVECTKNQKGGFYINQARSLTFIRCHGFWNEDRNGATIKDYTVGTTASNIKFINCWSESTGEHEVLDPKHLCAGFFVDGGKNISFDNCISEYNSRAFHIKSGDNVVIDNPTHSQVNWQASLDILIESTANNVSVINYRPESSVRIANFSSTSEIHFNAEKPTSGRIPFNAHYKVGNRGKAHCYQQGTVALFEINATGVSATAGDNYMTYTSTNLRVGDNVVVPGAGTAGAGLNAQITDIDMTQNRLYLSTNIVTTISGAVPATAQAKVFSQAYSTSAIANAQEGDIVWESFPNTNKRAGRICTVGGATPTWQAFGTWV